MGTRADIYVGRGKDAEWVGSFAFDGYPDGIRHPSYPHGRIMLEAKTEAEFRAALAEFFKEKGERQVTTPDMGWPWPWENSHTTDYAYAFDGDRVYVSRFGHGWREAAGAGDDTEYDRSKTAEFPDMRDRQNVTYGPRSGLIVGGM